MASANIAQAADISPMRRQLARRIRVLRAVHGRSQLPIAYRKYFLICSDSGANLEKPSANLGVVTGEESMLMLTRKPGQSVCLDLMEDVDPNTPIGVR